MFQFCHNRDNESIWKTATEVWGKQPRSEWMCIDYDASYSWRLQQTWSAASVAHSQENGWNSWLPIFVSGKITSVFLLSLSAHRGCKVSKRIPIATSTTSVLGLWSLHIDDISYLQKNKITICSVLGTVRPSRPTYPHDCTIFFIQLNSVNKK